MIRLAEMKDLNRILEIYKTAREFMKKNGNETQWGENHPPREMIKNDMINDRQYVCAKNGVIQGTFVFIIGNDPTYSYIEKGAWKKSSEYGTIHRIASDGIIKGVFAECLDFCKCKTDYIRIDTHENNSVMQHLLNKHGFLKSGIIYVRDGTPRTAYEYIKEQEQSALKNK